MDLKRAWKITGCIVAVAGVASFLPVSGEPIADRARSLVILVSIGAIFFVQGARGDQFSKWLALLGIPLAVWLMAGRHQPRLSLFLGLSLAALGVAMVAAGRLLGARSSSVRAVYAIGGAIALSGVLMAIWYARN